MNNEDGSTTPARLAHHKEWDKYVRRISGGLTILSPAKGQWMNDDELVEERIIPVMIMCTEKQIIKVAEFTKKHYRQKAVMFFKMSEEARII